MNDALTIAMGAVSRIEAFGHQAAVVGGSVRDCLLCREAREADIATSASLEDIRTIWPECRYVGKGTLKAAIISAGGIKLDVAPFQGKDLEEDLARRDLTINAMAMTSGGEIVDPGGGLADMASGVLRFNGKPFDRLSEDPIRSLRLARFSSSLPGFTIDPVSAVACRRFSAGLDTLPLPRIGREMLRGIVGDTSRFMNSLDRLGILEGVLPFFEALSPSDREQVLKQASYTGMLTDDTAVRGAALLAPAGSAAAGIAAGWNWPRSVVREIASFSQWRDLPFGESDAGAFASLHRKMGRKWIERLFLLALSECPLKNAGQEQRLRTRRLEAAVFMERLDRFYTNASTGDIIREAGMKEGPLIPEIIYAIDRAVAAGSIISGEEAYAMARSLRDSHAVRTFL